MIEFAWFLHDNLTIAFGDYDKAGRAVSSFLKQYRQGSFDIDKLKKFDGFIEFRDTYEDVYEELISEKEIEYRRLLAELK